MTSDLALVLLSPILAAILLSLFFGLLYRSGYFAFPDHGSFRRSDPYDEAMQMAELYTVSAARRGAGYALLLLGLGHLLRDPAPAPLVSLAFVLPWTIVGACVAFVFARRVLQTPMLFAERMRLLKEIAEEGSFDSPKPSDARTEFAEWTREYVATHKRDLVASVAMLVLLFASASRGTHVFYGSIIAFALGLHVGWYACKRWYLAPRVSHALQTTQLVFRIDWS